MKRLVYILIFTIGLSFTSFAQNRSIDTDPVNMQQKMIKTYPNPASVVINFSFQHSYDKSYTIEIYNFIGKKVQEFNYFSAILTAKNVLAECLSAYLCSH